MAKLSLKKIAKTIAEENTISSKNASFIMKELSLKDLKNLLSFLKHEALKNNIETISSDKLPVSIKDMLSKKFTGKHITETVDATLGAGMKVKAYDMIYDLTVMGHLKQIALKIEDSL